MNDERGSATEGPRPNEPDRDGALDPVAGNPASGDPAAGEPAARDPAATLTRTGPTAPSSRAVPTLPAAPSDGRSPDPSEVWDTEGVGGEPAEPREEKVMTLVEHLAELRLRVAISLIAVILGTIVGFVLAPRIIALLLQPLPGGEVQALTLSGPLYLQLRVALVMGIFLALPVVLYEIWAFVAPGLTPRERRAALPWIPLTIIFFVLGAVVAWVTLPYAVAFLAGFALPGVPLRPSAEAYFGFVTTIFLVFGLVMQFPTAIVLLAKLGVLSVQRLRAGRRYVLLGIVVFAVVVTPGGDPVSPLVLTGVMYVLYELTILLLSRSSRPEPEGG